MYYGNCNFKRKEEGFYLKELNKMENTTNKISINTIIPNFCYKNKEREVIVPKTSVLL
jgi:hypothetical protein